MDPSTTAHTSNAGIDPAILHVQATQSDGIPSLGVQPVSEIKAGSNNPFLDSKAPESVTSNLNQSAGTSHSTSDSTSKSASSTSTSGPTATGLRQRVNNLGSQLDSATHQAADHPAVKNAKNVAQKEISQLREQLGRSQTLRDLERRFNIDRVYLVFGGVLLYILLIPLNLFGLALPTTTLLTLLPPSFIALGILDSKDISNEANEAATKSLLAYFVTLGFIQFLESLAAGVLERRIPQYYTVKLLVLAYLLHPRTQGAMKLHESIYRPLFVQGAASSPLNTPPQSKEAGSSASSPTFPAASGNSGANFNSTSGSGLATGASGNNGTRLDSGMGSGLATGASVPSFGSTGSIGSTGSTVGVFATDEHGNIVKAAAVGQGFDVVTELH